MKSVHGRRFDMDLQATPIFEEGHARGDAERPVTYFGPNVLQMGFTIARCLTATYDQHVSVSVSEQSERPSEYPVITIALDSAQSVGACAQAVAAMLVNSIIDGGRALLDMTIVHRAVHLIRVTVSHFDIAWLYPFDAETLVLNEWVADVTRTEPGRVLMSLTMTSSLADEQEEQHHAK